MDNMILILVILNLALILGFVMNRSDINYHKEKIEKLDRNYYHFLKLQNILSRRCDNDK